MSKRVIFIGAVFSMLLVSACSLTSALLPDTEDIAEIVVDEMMEDEMDSSTPEDENKDTAAEDDVDLENSPAPGEGDDLAGSDESAATTASGTCSNVFFPIREGSLYTYSSNAYGAEDTYFQSYRDVSEEGFTVVTSFEDGNEVEVAWECTEDGLVSSEFRQMGMMQDMQFDLSTNDFSGVWIPPEDQWVVGKSWDAIYTVDIDSEVEGISIEMTMNIELANTITAVEPVSVGAGDFPEAYRVESVGVLAIDTFGTETPLEFINWYVRDVGMIQSQIVDAEGMYEGAYEVELISLEQ